jgi:uncharacterized protein YndB with AHSA1/START domain
MATFWLPTVPHRSMFGNRAVAGAPKENRGEMSTEVHEETIEAPPEDVWGFMVDPAALSAWFGADAWLEPEPGGVVRFRFAGGVERRGRVEHVAPFRTLTWRWREHLGAGFGSRIGEPSFVTIDLRRVPGGTRVRITERAAPALAEAGR